MRVRGENVKLIIEAEPKEIAALVVAIQERQGVVEVITEQLQKCLSSAHTRG